MFYYKPINIDAQPLLKKYHISTTNYNQVEKWVKEIKDLTNDIKSKNKLPMHVLSLKTFVIASELEDGLDFCFLASDCLAGLGYLETEDCILLNGRNLLNESVDFDYLQKEIEKATDNKMLLVINEAQYLSNTELGKTLLKHIDETIYTQKKPLHICLIVDENHIDSLEQLLMRGKIRSVYLAKEEKLAETKRNEVNLRNVEAWHETQKLLFNKLASVKEATVQSNNLLNDCVLYLYNHLKDIQQETTIAYQKQTSIFNQLVEDYVLQFGKMYIELYDLIWDNYCYHKQLIEQTDNNDYQNAVMNYEDYLYQIVSDLAVFGIKEIHDNIGEKFSGSRHTVTNSSSFSNKTALISKSLRSGFIYEGLFDNCVVLQKQQVEVED